MALVSKPIHFYSLCYAILGHADRDHLDGRNGIVVTSRDLRYLLYELIVVDNLSKNWMGRFG